jgi:hypothetical protein
MSQPSGKPIYIPPFSGVRLIECRDHFQLVPVPDVRTVYGFGKIKTHAINVPPDVCNPVDFWTDLGPQDEVWCVAQWFVFADGHQEPGEMSFLRPECTEEEARESMEQMERFSSVIREDLLNLSQCFEATEEVPSRPVKVSWASFSGVLAG